MAGFLRFAIAGIVWMKAFASALACLIPLTTFADEEHAILHKAFGILTQHRLLSQAELPCSSLELDEVTQTATTVTVREKHDKKCYCRSVVICPHEPSASKRPRGAFLLGSAGAIGPIPQSTLRNSQIFRFRYLALCRHVGPGSC
ncbi:hypothetical protein DC522_16275 [Microvirga sp. KLBC 81]|nr:hypothetical protein DC522_16275 [Microvirga sp. KLBC 81]